MNYTLYFKIVNIFRRKIKSTWWQDNFYEIIISNFHILLPINLSTLYMKTCIFYIMNIINIEVLQNKLQKRMFDVLTLALCNLFIARDLLAMSISIELSIP